MASALTFTWSGKGRDGKATKGETSANNKDEVISQLRRQGVVVTSINAKSGMKMDMKLPTFGSGVTDKDIVIFTRQFATMIDAGLPLVQCLEILERQTDNKVLAKAIGQVRLDVEAGSTYADALGKHPKIFNALYVNLVAAGEAGGILDTILGRLTILHRKEHEDEEADKVGDGLSLDSHDGRRRRHSNPDDLRHPDVLEDVH